MCCPYSFSRIDFNWLHCFHPVVSTTHLTYNRYRQSSNLQMRDYIFNIYSVSPQLHTCLVGPRVSHGTHLWYYIKDKLWTIDQYKADDYLTCCFAISCRSSLRPPGRSRMMTRNVANLPSATRPLSKHLLSTGVSMLAPLNTTTTL